SENDFGCLALPGDHDRRMRRRSVQLHRIQISPRRRRIVGNRRMNQRAEQEQRNSKTARANESGHGSSPGLFSEAGGIGQDAWPNPSKLFGDTATIAQGGTGVSPVSAVRFATARAQARACGARRAAFSVGGTAFGLELE